MDGPYEEAAAATEKWIFDGLENPKIRDESPCQNIII